MQACITPCLAWRVAGSHHRLARPDVRRLANALHVCSSGKCLLRPGLGAGAWASLYFVPRVDIRDPFDWSVQLPGAHLGPRNHPERCEAIECAMETQLNSCT